MEGLGNRFVVFEGPLEPSATDVVALCTQQATDGVLVISPVNDHSVDMRYWNADGSVAEMCGNGLRCAARFAVERKMVGAGTFGIVTGAGLLEAKWDGVDPEKIEVQVGKATVETEPLNLYQTTFHKANVGNPHAITFVDDLENAPVETLGPKIEVDEHFPNRTNVEFVLIENEHTIHVRTWERGVGETQACGTGMVAAANAAVQLKGVAFPLEVVVLGGRAKLWVDSDGFTRMIAPALNMPNYTPRTDSTELPSAAELLDILTKESQRKAVRFDFVQMHGHVFDAHRELAELAGEDDSWIESYPEETLNKLKRKVDSNHAGIAAYIQDHPDAAELYERVYNALIPAQDESTSDTLFVFGAASNARAERAVELYQQGVAPKIIISGNSPHYKETHQSEAARMADFVTQRGVPETALILEEQSITLPDNVKCTLDLLEKQNWRPQSITLIATNFVLTRATMEWYKFCPWNIKIKVVAAHPQSRDFTAEGWWKTPATIALVLNEYVKLIIESKLDLMRENGEIA